MIGYYIVSGIFNQSFFDITSYEKKTLNMSVKEMIKI